MIGCAAGSVPRPSQGYDRATGANSGMARSGVDGGPCDASPAASSDAPYSAVSGAGTTSFGLQTGLACCLARIAATNAALAITRTT